MWSVTHSIQDSRDKGMHLAARLIAFCFVLFLSETAFGDSLTGKVVKITDGDTLYVLDANYEQHRVCDKCHSFL